MYSEDYDDEDEELDEIKDENFIVSFYRNNKILVWILLGIILFIIIMSLLTSGGSNSSDNKKTYDVTIEPSGDVYITIGSSQHLIATVDGDANPVLSWSVTDSSIATVDDGVVKAINYGTTSVIASYKDRNGDEHKGNKTIIVGEGTKDVLLYNVEFKNGDLFMPVGSEYKISLILTPSNAFIENLSYTSSNTSVVTVDNTGLVTSHGSGEATISYNVNNGAFRGDLKVYVDQDYTFSEIITTPQTITFDGQLRKIKIGETDQLTYVVNPSDASRSKFTWSSSNTSVVSVDEMGNIKGISEGEATITVKSVNGVFAKIDVEVAKDIVEVSDISLDTSELDMVIGETKEIIPTISPDDASNKALSYSSSNETVAVVVPNNVGTSAKIYALATGRATISVRATNNIERSLIVNVTGSSSSDDSSDYDWSGSNYGGYTGGNTGGYTGGNTGGYTGGNTGGYTGGSTSTQTSTPKPTPKLETGLSVKSSPDYVFYTIAEANSRPAPGAIVINIRIPAGVSYVLYGTAKNGATCTPTVKKTSSFGLNVPKGALYELCMKKYDHNGNELRDEPGHYSYGALRYYARTGQPATATPRPTATPTPRVSISCSKTRVNVGDSFYCDASITAGDSIKQWSMGSTNYQSKSTRISLKASKAGTNILKVVTTKGASATINLTFVQPATPTPAPTVRLTVEDKGINGGQTKTNFVLQGPSGTTYAFNESANKKGTFTNTILTGKNCIAFTQERFSQPYVGVNAGTKLGIPFKRVNDSYNCTATVQVKFVGDDGSKATIIKTITVKAVPAAKWSCTPILNSYTSSCSYTKATTKTALEDALNKSSITATTTTGCVQTYTFNCSGTVASCYQRYSCVKK